MQFTPTNCTLITAGMKTETRRPLKTDDGVSNRAIYITDKNGRSRLRYKIGGNYALQPGRGQRGYEGVKLNVLDIRVERLHDITDEGGHAEGYQGRDGFRKVWEVLYPRGEFAWDNNPRVAVIKFKLTESR